MHFVIVSEMHSMHCLYTRYVLSEACAILCTCFLPICVFFDAHQTCEITFYCVQVLTIFKVQFNKILCAFCILGIHLVSLVYSNNGFFDNFSKTL